MDQQTLRFHLARFWVAWLSLQGICRLAQAGPLDLLAGRAAGALPEDATQEQGYYLQQLFRQYGENGTLSFEGLTRLLLSLGLGKVQVVEIEHEELGHGHVSHLDILEVQENKHLHSHSALDHLSKTEPRAKTQAESVTPSSPGFSPLDHTIRAPVSPALHGVSHVLKPSSGQGPEHSGKGKEESAFVPSRSKLSLLEGVIALDHSVFNHLHEDCLNVSQLLVNFGLNTVSKITPEQFTLLCPALLYQIDSRVCIQHLDDVTFDMAGSSLWNGLGWGFLAITLTSVPSALAIVLVPLLSREIFQFLLTFLVALAVGTLCGDALLHLWPHAQAQASSHGLLSSEEDGILKGLCVLGGIYFLFLIENLMGTLNQVRAKRKGAAGKQPKQSPTKVDENDVERTSQDSPGAEFQSLRVPEEDTGNVYDEAQDCSIQIHNSEGHGTSLEKQTEEIHHHGDCAVLLRAGMSLRWVLLFNLLSAFLAYWGTVLGTIVSQTTSQVTPWIFATTAGVFLYVALADMLPEMLQRHPTSSNKRSFTHFVLQNLGFLTGGGLMLCIALFEEHIGVHMDE